jgi:hypothetical protein
MFLLGIGKGFDHAAIADTTVATFVDHVLQLGSENRDGRALASRRLVFT